MKLLFNRIRLGTFAIFNGPDPENPEEKLEDLRNRLFDLNQQMANIQAKADAEKRPLMKDEATMVEDLYAQFESTEQEIDRRTRIAATSQRISKGQGRQTDPNRPHYGEGARTEEAFKNDANKWGFRSFGEYAREVFKGSAKGARLDPRIVANAPTTTSTEGVGVDGGFAIPPDFRTAIMQKVMGEQALLARTDQLVSSSNAITVPTDETTDWQATGGIQATWEGEGAQKTQSKVALDQTTVRLNKLTVLCPVTDELLEDVPALSTYLNRKAPQKINFKVTNAIINGTGAGQPLGILNSPAKISVTRDTAAHVVFDDVVGMYARLFTEFRQNAIWLMNPDVEPELLSLAFPGAGVNTPMYIPPGGLSNSPFATLLGRPVVATEAAQALGTSGDIILTDLQQYLTATKVGGIRQDVSIHLWFDYDTTAFRFVLRVGGQPWWKAAISPLNGSNTRSSIVTLT